MIMISFKSKKDKEHLLERARKMEEYASMIVDCIEESKESDDEYSERIYKREYEEQEPERYSGRYGYKRMR